jgi:hypothetical protein
MAYFKVYLFIAMSQLTVNPSFDSCCQGSSSSESSTNPTVYYDSSLGTPTQQSIKPPFTGFPAIAIDTLGKASQYVWNVTSQAWL